MAASSSSQLSRNDFLPNEDSKRSSTSVNQELLSVPQSKSWRVAVWEETKQCLQEGKYLPYRGQPSIKNDLPPLDVQIRVASLHTLPKISSSSSSSSASSSSTSIRPLQITCYRGDCLDAARDCFVKYKGAPPLVMDAASHRRPGGGYQSGSRAQEEEMCRRSSLAFQIDTTWKRQNINPYPLKNGSGLLVTNTSVFRAGAAENYAFLPSPFRVHFGVVAAPNQPALTPDGTMMLSEGESMMMNSLRLFFRMGAACGAKAVVPVSLGCGAFRCPAPHVAKLMMQAIVEECAGTCVEEVAIAIFDDHNAVRRGNEDGNFAPFARAAANFFGDQSVTIVDESGEDLMQEIVGRKPSLPAQQQQNHQVTGSFGVGSKAQRHQQQQQQQQTMKNEDSSSTDGAVKYELV